MSYRHAARASRSEELTRMRSSTQEAQNSKIGRFSLIGVNLESQINIDENTLNYLCLSVVCLPKY